MLRSPTQPPPRKIEDLLDSRLIASLTGLDISSRKIFAGKLQGERRSKKRGQSVEFADHRQYVSGDDLRRIDWNIFGRLDRLFLKLFLEEEDLSLHLVLDASGSGATGEPNKYRFMQKAAMSLGYIGLVNLNRVAATIIGGAHAPDDRAPADGDSRDESALIEGGLSSIRDLRGRRRTQDLSRFMCSVVPGGSANFKDAARRIVLQRRGKGVMVVFSDFFMKDGYEEGLRLLVGRGYDVFCVQVLSPQEIEPPITGDLRLRDIEDADMAEVTISAPLLKRYKENLAAYCGQLQLFCARREITLLTVRSDTEVQTLLLDYMRKRGLLT
jgi:uncharacterized protein (DUF58 family)